MAVPFRRTSKTAKRKRRTHKKLRAPALVVCKETGEFTLPHRVTRNSGYYKGRLVLTKKEKDIPNDEALQEEKKTRRRLSRKERSEKKVEAKKTDVKKRKTRTKIG